MPGFLIDLHCHTRDHSYDGKVKARDMVAKLHSLGFSGVVFTDHNYVWPEEELAVLREECGLSNDNFLILSGQEVRTAMNGVTYGDLLVYGLKESLPDDTSPLQIFSLIEHGTAFCTAPHPAISHIGFGDHLGSFPVIAAETWNGRYGKDNSAKAVVLAQEHGLPQVGGSDAHHEREIGGGGTLFGEMPHSLVDIQRLIREGSCKPWQPSKLSAAKRWLGITKK
ncbi:PHP domain-containing protein [Candidatus Sumerlaeota bacterium]|nr:PHP domain-containing protein [Candidatus Sumerlaeota bacterium]